MPRKPLCPWCGGDDPDECEALAEVGSCPWDGQADHIHFEGDDEEAPTDDR